MLGVEPRSSVRVCMHAYLRLRVWFSVQVVRVGVAKCERVEYKRKD